MTSYEKYTKPSMPETIANIDSPLVKEETVKIILSDIGDTLTRLNGELFDINNAIDKVNLEPTLNTQNPPELSIMAALLKIREDSNFALRQAINIRERLW